jgi:hypothetical protein
MRPVTSEHWKETVIESRNTSLAISRGHYGLPDLIGNGAKAPSDRHGSAFDPDDPDRSVTDNGLARWGISAADSRFGRRATAQCANVPVRTSAVIPCWIAILKPTTIGL